MKNPTREKHLYPLRGLICCGNCRRTMTRRLLRSSNKYIYSCTHSTRDKNTECAVHEQYEETELERVAYNAIGQTLTLIEKKAVQEREVSSTRKSAIRECMSQGQAEQLKAAKLRWYEKYTSGDISRDEYRKRKSEVDQKLAENAEAQQKEESRMEQLDSERSCSDKRMDAVCGEYANTTHLTYELAHAFIKAIYIYAADRIEIEWKSADIFAQEYAASPRG